MSAPRASSATWVLADVTTATCSAAASGPEGSALTATSLSLMPTSSVESQKGPLPASLEHDPLEPGPQGAGQANGLAVRTGK